MIRISGIAFLITWVFTLFSINLFFPLQKFSLKIVVKMEIITAGKIQFVSPDNHGYILSGKDKQIFTQLQQVYRSKGFVLKYILESEMPQMVECFIDLV